MVNLLIPNKIDEFSVFNFGIEVKTMNTVSKSILLGHFSNGSGEPSHRSLFAIVRTVLMTKAFAIAVLFVFSIFGDSRAEKNHATDVEPALKAAEASLALIDEVQG
jgi:hypothetical protein